MSAKETYKRPILHIEVLPDDLLIEVLRHATWVPYGIGASDLVLRRLQSTEAIAIAREYKASLVTKRYLVLVCKKWYRLALLYLYEWIQAVKVKNLPGLVHAVERSVSSNVQDRAIVGWCTKRFDIAFRRTGTETTEQLNDIGSLLLRLLHDLHNLEVLTIGRCSDHDWMDPAVHNWCPNLKYMNWTEERYTTSADVWQHFLRCHPGIIGLNPSGTGQLRGRPIQFTHSLRTWVTDTFSPVPIVAFAALERLSLNVRMLYLPARTWVEPFIGGALPSLKILQLNFIAIPVNPSMKTLRPLFRFMPNVRRVEVILPLWPPKWEWWEGDILPGTVSVLGVRVCGMPPKLELTRTVMRGLNHVVDHAHGPLEIEFLDRGTLHGILMHEKHIVRQGKGWKLLDQFLGPEGEEYTLILGKEIARSYRD